MGSTKDFEFDALIAPDGTVTYEHDSEDEAEVTAFANNAGFTLSGENAALAEAVARRVIEGLRGEKTVGIQRVLADYDEAAIMLGISRAALEKRVQRHQLPPGSIVRTGDRVQFHIERLREMNPRRRSVR